MPPTNIEILAYEDSPLGPLCLRRRELLSQPGTVVTEVTLNHEFLMSSLYTDSEQALAQVAIQMHGGDGLNVLIGGLGLGYTAWATLASDRIKSVTVVELLPPVIEWAESGMIPLSSELNRDPRLTITQGDIYQRMSASPEQRFDLILIDVDHSPDERLGQQDSSFYSTKGLRLAAQHLAHDGVVGVWSYAESSPFADALGEVFNDVRVEPVTHENQMINETHTDWLFFARSL